MGKDSSERRKNEVRGIPVYEEKVGFFTKTTEKKGTADRQERQRGEDNMKNRKYRMKVPKVGHKKAVKKSLWIKRMP
jgi:hypothetical protein